MSVVAKTVMYLIVVGGEQPSKGMPGEAMPSRGEGRWLKNLLGRYARCTWKGSPGTLKSWLTQTTGVGMTP